MRKIAYSRIEQISYNFTNPMRASRLMRDFISCAMKVTNSVLTKNVLLKFRDHRVGFREVEDMAERLLSQQKNVEKSREKKYEIVKDMMKHELKNAEDYEKFVRKELNRSKTNLNEVVRQGTIARYEFMNTVDVELNLLWNKGKTKNIDKVNWAESRNKVVKEDEETFKGILIGDKHLEELEKKSSDENDRSESCVYGGVELKDNLKEILNIPPKHTIFPNLKIEEFETELQKCEVKIRWQTQREERNKEDLKKKAELKESGEENTTVDTEVSTKDSIDFRNLKATDMRNNKRIVMPELGTDEDEIRRSNVKHELKEVFLKYRKEKCDKFGNILENNLDKEQMSSIKELKTKIKEDGLVCYKTDKTGKLAIDTLENYATKMNKHIKDDIEITEKKMRSIENKLNEHMEDWVGFTGAGENNQQTKRVKSNLKTKGNQPPVLRGTSKDHKIATNVIEGPDLRPIMGSVVGPNVAASNFVSEIIRKIADLEDEGSVCKSTEEMLYKFDQFNKRRNAVSPKMRKLIIGSMDIEKWYPNTIPKPTAKKINHMYVKSKLQIKNMKYDKLARYLGKVLTREEILQEKMEEILYIKEGKLEEKRKYKKKKQSLDIIGGGGKTLNTAEVNDGGGYQNKNKIKEKRKYKKKKQSLDIIGGGGKTLNTEQANNGGGYENTKKNMNRKRAVTKKVNKVNKRIEKKNEIKKKEKNVRT